MKKPLFSLICAFALLFSGCSKEETAAPKDEKLYPVTFNVSTFSKQIVPMASLKTAGQINASTTSATALKEAIRSIDYAVYNEAGIKVNEKTSYYTEASFGMIEDSLPKGKYTILVFGTNKRYDKPPSDVSGTYSIGNSSGGDDVFLSQVTIEVTGSPINQNLVLYRKVGKVEIVLSDQIPSGIEEIVYTVTGVAYYFFPHTFVAYNTSISNSYYNYDESEPDYTQDFGTYFFLQYDLDAIASVNIRAYDRNRNLVADKTINDVPVGINKKTILTGKLFDEVGTSKGQAFSITVDNRWNSESNHVEF